MREFLCIFSNLLLISAKILPRPLAKASLWQYCVCRNLILSLSIGILIYKQASKHTTSFA